jgi:hypothetical protein
MDSPQRGKALLKRIFDTQKQCQHTLTREGHYIRCTKPPCMMLWKRGDTAEFHTIQHDGQDPSTTPNPSGISYEDVTEMLRTGLPIEELRSLAFKCLNCSTVIN